MDSPFLGTDFSALVDSFPLVVAAFAFGVFLAVSTDAREEEEVEEEVEEEEEEAGGVALGARAAAGCFASVRVTGVSSMSLATCSTG